MDHVLQANRMPVSDSQLPLDMGLDSIEFDALSGTAKSLMLLWFSFGTSQSPKILRQAYLCGTIGAVKNRLYCSHTTPRPFPTSKNFSAFYTSSLQ